MSLYSSRQEPPEEKSNSMYLINPSIEEFKTTYFNDKNEPIEVILAPLETKSFPLSIGRIVLNHLANFILNKGGFSYKTDINLELAEIKKKCVIYE